MAENNPNPQDTRTRILDAAESLFSDEGFRSVSLRQITAEANVNIAAVNYHFGSREALVDEVLARVISPINQRRLELLDRAEARHGSSYVPLEEMLEAFHRPVVDQITGSPHHSSKYLKLAGRCLAEPAENFSDRIVELFQEVVSRFMAAAGRALPHLDKADVFWRMHFSVGTMIFALTHEDRVAQFSGGTVCASDPEDTLRRLIEFTAGGLRAEPEPEKEKSATRKKSASLVTVLTGALLLSSCQSLSPPDAKHRASVSAPGHWVAGSSYRPTHFPDRNWIENFGDSNLETFVNSVLENNHDLKAAQSRIEIAQANAKIIGADLYPQLGGNFSGRRNLQNFIGFPIPGAAPGDVLSTRTNTFGLSLDLSWELDLWGRISAAQSAAIADFEASQFDRSTAELSLAGQAAKAWFALAEARDQVALSRSTITTFKDTENSIRDRFENGIDDNQQNIASQLLLSEADVATARDGLASRQELMGRTARQLEVLAGKYPAGQAGKTAKLPGFPSKVPADLPATLLDRRPDLAAAERRIAAADERLFEAKRSLLPRLSLTSNFGTSTEDIGELLNGDFSVWSLAGNAVQPLLQGGRLRANITRRDAEVQLAAAQFEQAALTAFAEVENALAAESFLNTRADALSRSADLSKQAYLRSLEEFNNGTGDILTVLTAQQRLFSTRSQLLTIRRLRLDNRVDLYLALGGSFRPYEGPPEEKDTQS